MGKARYIARYFCSLNDPDATDTWFLIDRRTGVPVFKDGSLRLYSRQEVKVLLAQADGDADPAVDAEEAQWGMEGVEAPGRGAETSEAQMSEVYREKGEKLYLPEG